MIILYNSNKNNCIYEFGYRECYTGDSRYIKEYYNSYEQAVKAEKNWKQYHWNVDCGSYIKSHC